MKPTRDVRKIGGVVIVDADHSTAALAYSEESVAIGRGRQVLPRRQRVSDAWDAYLQADEPPLSFVVEFDAAEREWDEGQARLTISS